ncbi:hypothetical protein B0J12DRAFT_24807 [Macrophomina phaseolina]|uniref:Integrase catalytic domain-containing protein n=1 Tax=Macrophomina phaseolina TaxID=35725 RepID=A0ABQ8GV06_9PEZI|nr:hypothetical protein B0J12DRAFT_24807 [Macrophomina phaseolina]
MLKLCANCVRRRHQQIARAPVRPIVVNDLFEKVQMDLVDHNNRPDSVTGDRYVLHMRDYFTDYSVLIPLLDKSPRTVATEVLRWIVAFGPPKSIQTDRGELRETPGERASFCSILGGFLFKSYLYRFDHVEDDRCYCSGTAKQTPRHLLLDCYLYRAERLSIKDALKKPILNLTDLFTTNKGTQATAEFLRKTKIFTRRWILNNTPDGV